MQSLFSYEWGSFRAIVLTWALCGSQARNEIVDALQKEFRREPIRLVQFLEMTFWNPAMIRLVPEMEIGNAGSSAYVEKSIASLVFTNMNSLRQFAMQTLAENRLANLIHRGVVERFLRETDQPSAEAGASAS